MLQLPIPVAIRSKEWVCGRSLARIAGSNPARGIDVSVVSVVFCHVNLTVSGWSLFQRSLTECGESWVWSRRPTRGCCTKKIHLLLMPQIVGTQRKCSFFALRTVTKYPKMINAIEHAVVWVIVWPGGGGGSSWSPLSPNLIHHPDSFMWTFVKDKVSFQSVTITGSNFTKRIQKATASTGQPLLQIGLAGHKQHMFILYSVHKLSEFLFTTVCL
jgi:hypothetical protein